MHTIKLHAVLVQGMVSKGRRELDLSGQKWWKRAVQSCEGTDVGPVTSSRDCSSRYPHATSLSGPEESRELGVGQVVGVGQVIGGVGEGGDGSIRPA